MPVQGQDAPGGGRGVSEKSGCRVGSPPMLLRLLDFLFYTAVAAVAVAAIALIVVSLVG